jgi:hypothetical protein
MKCAPTPLHCSRQACQSRSRRSVAQARIFRERIRQAIAAGLGADDALKAATVTPAALLA